MKHTSSFKPSLPKITSSAVRKPIIDPDEESIDKTFESITKQSISGIISSDFDCNTFIVNESVNTSLSLGMSLNTTIELEVPQEGVENILLPIKEVHKLGHISSNPKGDCGEEVSQRVLNTMPSSCRMDRSALSLENNSNKKSSFPSFKTSQGVSRTAGLVQSKSSGTVRKIPEQVNKLSYEFNQAYILSGSNSKLITYDTLCIIFLLSLGSILKELGMIKTGLDNEQREMNILWKMLRGEKRGVSYDKLRQTMLHILEVGSTHNNPATQDAKELTKSFKTFYLNRNNAQKCSFGRTSSVKAVKVDNTKPKNLKTFERTKAKQVLKSLNFNTKSSRNKQSKSLNRTQKMNDSHYSNRPAKANK
jgi:hypothetical protein